MQKGDVLILITYMTEKLEKLTLANKPFQYVVTAYFFAVLPTLILSAFLYFAGLPPQNKVMPENSSPWIDFVGTSLFAPMVETLLMFPIFWALRIFTSRIGWLCIWSALIWALLHSALHPVWGLTTFWTFLVLSFSFLMWERRSKMWAFAITAIIHIINNTVVMIAVIFSR
jgi:hypothetical protein